MKEKILTLCTLALSLVFQGCMTYNDGATTAWNGHSQAGTPVKTRLTGSDEGFRIFFIGTSPSERVAIDNLYKAAENSGYKIEGANYSFQNMTSELSGFLYPFIGYGKLTVTADLYKYDYKGTQYNVQDTNSTLLEDNKTSIAVFERFF